jgi:hypothetical protein
MFVDFIWSKGIFERNKYMLQENTDIISSNDVIINEILNCNNYLWIRSTCKNYHIDKLKSDLDIVSDNLHLIKNPVILITSDGDRKTPSSYNIDTVNKILNSNKIIKWFTQNYDRSIIHNKLNYFPIGLDLHSYHTSINNCPIQKINYYKDINKSDIQYIRNKIFCDSHLHMNGNERQNMYDILKNNNSIDFLDTVLPIRDIITKYRNYKFVLSPEGNGLDCHRTWELFLLGVIVITKTSPLDNLWIQNSLPVVILNEWKELNFSLQNKLNTWYNIYDRFTNLEYILSKFNYNYWLSK